jgi:O-antigen ligase
MNTFENTRTFHTPTERAFSALNAQLGLIVFFAAHVPLALLMREYRDVATLHAVATLVIGLWWAVSRSRPDRAIYVCAYITGAEVLWRMVGAQVFWEFGKYAVAAILIIAILRGRRLQPPISILTYFLLLLPSAGLVLADNSLAAARQDISFNLSGPFALMISAWFFSRLKLSGEVVLRLFAALIGPLVGIASLTIFATLTARSIKFVNESNLATSGGFGPNQVSAALGLGALLCFVALLQGSGSKSVRLFLGLLLIAFAAQSALTFSRGGLFMAFASAMLTSLFIIRNPRARVRLLVLGLLLFLVGSYVVLPKLEAFTRGNLITRFQNTSSTRRNVIAGDDLKTWEQNPILGVGPGQAKYRHESFRRVVAAHTEFSRLLAEHGSFGFAALVLLLFAASRTITRANAGSERVVKVMVISWSFLFMLGDAMRLVAPAFFVGIAFAVLYPEAAQVKERYQLRWGKYFPAREESEAHNAVGIRPWIPARMELKTPTGELGHAATRDTK